MTPHRRAAPRREVSPGGLSRRDRVKMGMSVAAVLAAAALLLNYYGLFAGRTPRPSPADLDALAAVERENQRLVAEGRISVNNP